MKTAFGVFRENFLKSELAVSEDGDKWPVRGTPVEVCLGDIFRQNVNRKAQLCLDFMGDAISDGKACEKVLGVSLVDYMAKHRKQLIPTDGAERHFIEGNIHGGKVWRTLRERLKSLGRPDLIIMRPKGAGLAWSYEFPDLNDYDPSETFSRIYAFFRVVERLYELLEIGGTMYIEIYAPVVICSQYGTYSVFQRILGNYENQNVEYVYGNHNNITALKIRKNPGYPPLKLLRKRIDEYFGIHKDAFKRV